MQDVRLTPPNQGFTNTFAGRVCVNCCPAAYAIRETNLSKKGFTNGMTILYILLAILMLGVLIMIHEFGHFIFAKLLSKHLPNYLHMLCNRYIMQMNTLFP